jgi:hypothetical protein
MSEEVISAENVSKEMVKAVFDAALMETSYDQDGDIKVVERCKCFVRVDKERRKIGMMTFFRFKPGVSEAAKLQCANQINNGYIMVRALVKDNALIFTYDIPLDGGISRMHLVKLVKRFCNIPHDAVADFGRETVE